MKSLNIKLKLSAYGLIFGVLFFNVNASYANDSTCVGQFPNFITGVCWSCVFPIKMMGNVTVISEGQEDTESMPFQPVCYCSGTTQVGIPSSLWEPSRMVDVTPSPYCLVNLGGVRPTGGPNSTQYGGEIANPIVSDGKIHRMPPRRAFYQVHWYINPLFSVLNLITDDACLENKQFDLAYLSELDATHSDIDLANLLTPDAYLFSNVIALGACAADCVAATAGFPISTMFWCAGCNGGLYPLVGTVENHVGGIQSSSLMAQRIAAKLHRAGTQFASTGANGMCGLYPQLIMDKTMYKYAMLNPTPQTKKILGRCCQPFGRTTALWGVGMDPIIKPTISTSGATSIVTKPSYGYMIYRKRDCCQGIVGL